MQTKNLQITISTALIVVASSLMLASTNVVQSEDAPIISVKVTPVTPTPTPTSVIITQRKVSVPSSPEVEKIKSTIISEFSSLGSEAVDWGLRVANCESHYNPLAVNPTSGCTGLFQFAHRTFYGNGGKNILDPNDQIAIAKKMYANGQQYQWSCK